jgi:hypothetical protein
MAAMRGDDRAPDSMFSYVSAEQRVPQDYPLRASMLVIRRVSTPGRALNRLSDG